MRSDVADHLALLEALLIVSCLLALSVDQALQTVVNRLLELVRDYGLDTSHERHDILSAFGEGAVGHVTVVGVGDESCELGYPIRGEVDCGIERGKDGWGLGWGGSLGRHVDC